MRKAAIAAALAATLVGCETAPHPPAHLTRATRQIVDFSCADGARFTAAFLVSPDVVDLRFAGGKTVRLARRRTGVGFLYANARHSLRGEGGQATYASGARAPTLCRAVN